MTEREIKVLLTKEQYESLSKEFTWEETYEQVNIYYSPIVQLADKKVPTVRIRSKKGGLKLEVKVPKTSDRIDVKVNEEYAKDISFVPQYISGAELSELTGIRDMEDSEVEGLLATRRSISNEYEGVEIALDYNRYLGVTDYELEAEYTDTLPEEFLKRLEKHGIVFGIEPKGKYRRFRTLLKSI